MCHPAKHTSSHAQRTRDVAATVIERERAGDFEIEELGSFGTGRRRRHVGIELDRDSGRYHDERIRRWGSRCGSRRRVVIVL